MTEDEYTQVRARALLRGQILVHQLQGIVTDPVVCAFCGAQQPREAEACFGEFQSEVWLLNTGDRDFWLWSMVCCTDVLPHKRSLPE
jgi:hypothetical protein